MGPPKPRLNHSSQTGTPWVHTSSLGAWAHNCNPAFAAGELQALLPSSGLQGAVQDLPTCILVALDNCTKKVPWSATYRALGVVPALGAGNQLAAPAELQD